MRTSMIAVLTAILMLFSSATSTTTIEKHVPKITYTTTENGDEITMQEFRDGMPTVSVTFSTCYDISNGVLYFYNINATGTTGYVELHAQVYNFLYTFTASSCSSFTVTECGGGATWYNTTTVSCGAVAVGCSSSGPIGCQCVNGNKYVRYYFDFVVTDNNGDHIFHYGTFSKCNSGSCSGC
jgi:hypothetical protein